jgi:hypothetical protein
MAIPNHDVFTVAYLGWKGLENGALLRATEEAGFEVFVTADKKMPKQQNLKGRALALIVLSTLDWEIMKPHLSKIVAAVWMQRRRGRFKRWSVGSFSGRLA